MHCNSNVCANEAIFVIIAVLLPTSVSFSSFHNACADVLLGLWWFYSGALFSFPGPIKSHGSFSLEINKYKNERVNRNDQSSVCLFVFFKRNCFFAQYIMKLCYSLAQDAEETRINLMQNKIKLPNPSISGAPLVVINELSGISSSETSGAIDFFSFRKQDRGGLGLPDPNVSITERCWKLLPGVETLF